MVVDRPAKSTAANISPSIMRWQKEEEDSTGQYLSSVSTTREGAAHLEQPCTVGESNTTASNYSLLEHGE